MHYKKQVKPVSGACVRPFFERKPFAYAQPFLSAGDVCKDHLSLPFVGPGGPVAPLLIKVLPLVQVDLLARPGNAPFRYA